MVAEAKQVAAEPCQLLDRVVASMGNLPITQSDADQEYGFELLLEGKAPLPIPDPATLEQVVERLVDQKLLGLEAEAGDADDKTLKKAAAEQLAEVRKKFPNTEAFQSALRQLDMDEQQAVERIAQQQRILRVIDQRLRPAAAPANADIETYYRETFVPEYARKNSGPAPPLAEVEGKIREILVQRKIDQLLSQWLEELRTANRVRFHPDNSNAWRADAATP